MKGGLAILVVLLLSAISLAPSVVAQSGNFEVYVYATTRNGYAVLGENYTFWATVSLYAEQNVTVNVDFAVYVNGSAIFYSNFSLNVTLTGDGGDIVSRQYNVGFVVEKVGFYEIFLVAKYNVSGGVENSTHKFYIVAGERIVNGPISFEPGDYMKYESYQNNVKMSELTILFGEKISDTEINVTLISRYGNTTYNNTATINLLNRTMYFGSHSVGAFPFAIPSNLTEGDLVVVSLDNAYLVKGQTTIDALGFLRTAYIGIVADYMGRYITYYDIETGIMLKSELNSSYYVKLVDTNLINKSNASNETSTPTQTEESGTTGTEEESNVEEGGTFTSWIVPIAMIAIVAVVIVTILLLKKRTA